jgi:hypothetical protein
LVRNNNYEKGTRAEYLLRDHFLSLGCYVMRSAGSRGIADLLSISPQPNGSVHFIQVKSGELPLTDLQDSLLHLEQLVTTYGGQGSLFHYMGRNRWRIHRPGQPFEAVFLPTPDKPVLSPHDKQRPKNKPAPKRNMHKVFRRTEPDAEGS